MTTEQIKTDKTTNAAWVKKYNSKLVTAEEAVKVIKSNDKIIIQPGCATPLELINAMVKRKDELSNVEIYHILVVGDIPYIQPGMEKHFKHKAFFIGGNTRKAVNEGRAEFIPIFLSEVTLLFKRGVIQADVAMIHVSPPDEHGFCSYGIDVGNIKTPAEKAKCVIAQVNKQMPRGLGNSFIHISKIDFLVEVDQPLPELPQVDPDATPGMLSIFDKIGKNVATLIEDGSTLQMGIGAIPDAVLRYLHDKNDLGVHTEMFSDGLIELVELGVVNGEKKNTSSWKNNCRFCTRYKKIL